MIGSFRTYFYFKLSLEAELTFLDLVLFAKINQDSKLQEYIVVFEK